MKKVVLMIKGTYPFFLKIQMDDCIISYERLLFEIAMTHAGNGGLKLWKILREEELCFYLWFYSYLVFIM